MKLHDKKLSIILIALTLVKASLSLTSVQAQAQVPAAILWTGKIELPSGYSSTYLPVNKGYLTNFKFANSLEGFDLSGVDSAAIKVDQSEQTLWSRFEKARTTVLGRTHEENLHDFMHYHDYKPTYDKWQGLCDQYSAANCDPKIKKIADIANNEKSKSCLCGNVIFNGVDIRELLTANYVAKTKKFWGSGQNAPNVHFNDAFIYKLDYKKSFIDAHGGIEAFKELNVRDFKIIENLGLLNLPAHGTNPINGAKTILKPDYFHKMMSDELQTGNGVVLNVDPNEEVWNQPFFSMDSKATAISNHNNQTLPYFSYHADDAVIGNHFFYQASDEAGETKLTQMDHLDKILKIIVLKRDKTPDEKASEIVKQAQANDSSVVVDAHSLAFIEALEQTQTTTHGENLVPVIDAILAKKQELFQSAIDENGLKLKEQFVMQKMDTLVKYMDENEEFRTNVDKIVTSHYEYLVVKNNQNGFIYSNWLGPQLRDKRPSFIWNASQSADTCHEVYSSPEQIAKLREAIKEKNYMMAVSPNDWRVGRNTCLNAGLSDLLNICQQCETVENAYQKVATLIHDVATINDPETASNSLQEGLGQLKKRFIDVDEEVIKQEVVKARSHKKARKE